MLLDLPTRLETPRLIVRPYAPEDAAAYLEVCQDNRLNLLPYEAGNAIHSIETPEQAAALMRSFHDARYNREMFFFGA
jgi:RimJ/RimL family protein N-acetyltransferase